LVVRVAGRVSVRQLGASEEVVDRYVHRARERRAAFAWAPELADDAAAEADGDGMGARARLELREQVADVRFHGLLRKEEPDADLAVDQPVGNQLEHLDLAHRGLLLELPERALEGNHLGARARAAAGGDLLEPARVVGVAVQDLLALCGVHRLGYRRGCGAPLAAGPTSIQGSGSAA